MSKRSLDKTMKDAPAQSKQLYSLLSWGHAVYYLVTALWALVSIRTFQKVTGPKTDIWLVKTVSLLIGAVGVVLAYAGNRKEPVPEVPLLAISSAAGLTAIDVIYVAKKRISPIYLLDALGEVGLIALWAFWLRIYRKSRH